jgi:hypothetical protein
LTEDLLQQLGKEITFLTMLPPSGAILPEFGTLVEVRNEAAMEANVKKMVTQVLGLELRSTKFGDRTIHYGSDRGGRSVFEMAFNPSFTFAGGYLVMGSHPNAVKRILRTMDGNHPALGDDPDFKTALARTLAEAPAAGLVYFNTKRSFEYLHGIITPLVSMFGNAEDMPFDPMTIPSSESIAKHLSFSVNALRFSDSDMEVRSFSEGLSLSMVVMSGVALALAFQAQEFITGELGNYQVFYQLQSLRRGIEGYRREHKSAYPVRLADLVERWQGELDRAREECEFFAERAGLLAGTEFPDRTILAWCKELVRGCRFVLYANGVIDWLPEARFAERLAAQELEFKK